MNVVMLIGRLTKDPELRYNPTTGKPLTTFSIAVDRGYTGKDGVKTTDFFNVQIWGKNAENCANYLSKGRLVAIQGSLYTNIYEKDGKNMRYVFINADHVQFLDWEKKEEQEAGFELKGLDENGYRELDGDDVPF